MIVNTLRHQCGWPDYKCENDATWHTIYGKGQGFRQGDYCDEHLKELHKKHPETLFTDVPLSPLGQANI